MHELVGLLRVFAGVMLGFFSAFQLMLAAWALANRDFRLVDWGPALCVFLGLAAFSGWAAYRLLRGIPRCRASS